jgi:hypothetical protein
MNQLEPAGVSPRTPDQSKQECERKSSHDVVYPWLSIHLRSGAHQPTTITEAGGHLIDASCAI